MYVALASLDRLMSSGCRGLGWRADLWETNDKIEQSDLRCVGHVIWQKTLGQEQFHLAVTDRGKRRLRLHSCTAAVGYIEE